MRTRLAHCMLDHTQNWDKTSRGILLYLVSTTCVVERHGLGIVQTEHCRFMSWSRWVLIRLHTNLWNHLQSMRLPIQRLWICHSLSVFNSSAALLRCADRHWLLNIDKPMNIHNVGLGRAPCWLMCVGQQSDYNENKIKQNIMTAMLWIIECQTCYHYTIISLGFEEICSYPCCNLRTKSTETISLVSSMSSAYMPCTSSQ